MGTRKPKLGSIYQRGCVWWLKYYRNGKPFRESSKSRTYADAERLLKRRQGEIVTGKFSGLEPERIRVRVSRNGWFRITVKTPAGRLGTCWAS